MQDSARGLSQPVFSLWSGISTSRTECHYCRRSPHPAAMHTEGVLRIVMKNPVNIGSW